MIIIAYEYKQYFCVHIYNYNEVYLNCTYYKNNVNLNITNNIYGLVFFKEVSTQMRYQ